MSPDDAPISEVMHRTLIDLDDECPDTIPCPPPVPTSEVALLENAIEALIRLLERLVCGCEHLERGVCPICARTAHAAIVEARRTMNSRHGRTR